MHVPAGRWDIVCLLFSNINWYVFELCTVLQSHNRTVNTNDTVLTIQYPQIRVALGCKKKILWGIRKCIVGSLGIYSLWYVRWWVIHRLIVFSVCNSAYKWLILLAHKKETIVSIRLYTVFNMCSRKWPVANAAAYRLNLLLRYYIEYDHGTLQFHNKDVEHKPHSTFMKHKPHSTFMKIWRKWSNLK